MRSTLWVPTACSAPGHNLTFVNFPLVVLAFRAATEAALSSYRTENARLRAAIASTLAGIAIRRATLYSSPMAS